MESGLLVALSVSQPEVLGQCPSVFKMIEYAQRTLAHLPDNHNTSGVRAPVLTRYSSAPHAHWVPLDYRHNK